MSVIYKKVALIGLGLIASSMGHAMKRSGIAGCVVGHAKSKETRDTAMKLGFVDAVADSAADAVEQADLVVLCVPVGAMEAVAKEIAPRLKKGATVSDVGSVKQSVIDMVSPHIPDGVHFVPAHPLAGTEHSGPSAGFADLFKNRWCILTPIKGSDKKAVTTLHSYWEAMGANMETMDPDHHDLVLAVTSHAPHLIAYTMVGVADDLSRVTDTEVVNFSAAGFRDFTRWKFWGASQKSCLTCNAPFVVAMGSSCKITLPAPAPSAVALLTRVKIPMRATLVVGTGAANESCWHHRIDFCNRNRGSCKPASSAAKTRASASDVERKTRCNASPTTSSRSIGGSVQEERPHQRPIRLWAQRHYRRQRNTCAQWPMWHRKSRARDSRCRCAPNQCGAD